MLAPLSARGATNERSRDVTSVWARPRPRAVPVPRAWHNFLEKKVKVKDLGG